MKEKELFEFLESIVNLKLTARTGWIGRKVPKPLETIASHSFGVVLISWILAEGKKVDKDKIIKMALIHDLAEAYCGDITAYAEKYSIEMGLEEKILKDKKKVERSVLKRVIKPLDENLQKQITRLFNEFEEQKTQEAKIVYLADKIDELFQVFYYRKAGGGKRLKEFYDWFKRHKIFNKNLPEKFFKYVMVKDSKLSK